VIVASGDLTNSPDDFKDEYQNFMTCSRQLEFPYFPLMEIMITGISGCIPTILDLYSIQELGGAPA